MLIFILNFYKSSSTYLFLKEQEILSLSYTCTIRTYLSLINTQCGIDENFFLLFKKKVTMLKKEKSWGVSFWWNIPAWKFTSEFPNTIILLENFGGEIESLGLKPTMV